MSLKNLFFAPILIAGTLFASVLRADEVKIYFKTTPGSDLLQPFVDPADLSLLVTGADGRPVMQGMVAVRLEAPRSGRFFSTDYPLVEGTLLSAMQLPLRSGRANWKQLFPIRGEYRLSVDAVSADGSKANKVFTFTVRENPKKWLALGAFSAGLILLGFVAGRIFTAPRAVSLIAATLLPFGAAEISNAQTREPAGVLTVDPATVGAPSGIRWNSPFDGVNPTGAAMLSLTITHLEKNKVVFAVERIAVPDEWAMKFHFPDGGEYRVTAIGSVPGVTPVLTERVMTVDGVEPAAMMMVPVWVYFMGLIAAGLGAGRWTKRRQVIAKLDRTLG